jgi:pimeloyl-ACP methyl ester carboxylesterase
MDRRNFLALSTIFAMNQPSLAKSIRAIDAAWYAKNRRFAPLPMSRVAYIDHGQGPAALFLHGFPLGGFQWRGAIERLHSYRRCIVPDVMGMGFTETPQDQTISPATQVEMLTALLDRLRIHAVDIVANDSGGLVAQLFLAAHPSRVRSLLLTNCDVDENNPPAGFVPFAELAKKGLFAEKALLPQVKDKQLARSAKGLGGLTYTWPEKLSDEAIDTYIGPLVQSPLRKQQVDQYAVSLGSNVLVPIRQSLRQWKGPVRMVWAMNDPLFTVQWAEWLDSTLPGSKGIRRVEGANLFFPEEMPDLIAEEAAGLWSVTLRA